MSTEIVTGDYAEIVESKINKLEEGPVNCVFPKMPSKKLLLSIMEELDGKLNEAEYAAISAKRALHARRRGENEKAKVAGKEADSSDGEDGKKQTRELTAEALQDLIQKRLPKEGIVDTVKMLYDCNSKRAKAAHDLQTFSSTTEGNPADFDWDEGIRVHKAQAPVIRAIVKRRQRLRNKIKQKLEDIYEAERETWLEDCAKLKAHFDRESQESAEKELKDLPFHGHATRGTKKVFAQKFENYAAPEAEALMESLGLNIISEGKFVSEGKIRTKARKPEEYESLRADPMAVAYGRDRFVAFEDSNGLMNDPLHEERELIGATVWTEEEEHVFLEKYTIYPKNFMKVNQFLPAKSLGEIVAYYYKNKIKLRLRKAVNDFRKRRNRRRLQKHVLFANVPRELLNLGVIDMDSLTDNILVYGPRHSAGRPRRGPSIMDAMKRGDAEENEEQEPGPDPPLQAASGDREKSLEAGKEPDVKMSAFQQALHAAHTDEALDVVMSGKFFRETQNLKAERDKLRVRAGYVPFALAPGATVASGGTLAAPAAKAVQPASAPVLANCKAVGDVPAVPPVNKAISSPVVFEDRELNAAGAKRGRVVVLEHPAEIQDVNLSKRKKLAMASERLRMTPEQSRGAFDMSKLEAVCVTPPPFVAAMKHDSPQSPPLSGGFDFERSLVSPLCATPKSVSKMQNSSKADEGESVSSKSDGSGAAMWTEGEKDLWQRGVDLFGGNWEAVSELIGTKSPEQCQIFFNSMRDSGAVVPSSMSRLPGIASAEPEKVSVPGAALPVMEAAQPKTVTTEVKDVAASLPEGEEVIKQTVFPAKIITPAISKTNTVAKNLVVKAAEAAVPSDAGTHTSGSAVDPVAGVKENND